MRINEVTDFETNHEAQSFVDLIKRDCQHWIKESGLWTVLRGTSAMPDTYARVKVRQDRKPLDSSIKFQEFQNLIFRKAGLIANRSNSLFTTGNTEHARSFGNTCVVFPIGKFNYTWSPYIRDGYEMLDRQYTLPSGEKFGSSIYDKLDDSAFDAEEYANSMQKALEYQGDDGSLIKAIKSGNEIMIHCHEAYLIDRDFYTDEVFPILEDEFIK